METSSATTPATPRKKMPAEVFVKIWSNQIEIADTEWQQFVKFDLDDGLRRVTFSNIEICGKVECVNLIDFLLPIVFHNCCLPDFNLINVKIGSIKIKELSNTGDFWILGSEPGFIGIENSTTGNIRIDESTCRDIIVSGKSTLGRCRIFNSQMMRLSIYNSKLAEIQLWNSEIQRIWVEDDSFVSYIRFLFHPQKPTHLIFEDSTLPYFDLKNTTLPEFNTLMIRRCKINDFDLKHTCNYGSIFIDELSILNEWEDFESLKNKDWEPTRESGEYKTIKIQPKRPSSLRLNSSDLGKIQFINCNLRQFDRFEFSNTKMLDVFVAGSQMPNDSAFCLPGDEKRPVKIAEQKRLAYGQFKKIYEARGDVASSLPYLAYEMEAYRQQLQMEGWWINRGELTMLWMNKLSTNYGVSWQRGLAATIIATTFFYSVFCNLIGYRLENNGTGNVETFWKLVSYAPYYLNPLRDLDSVFLLPDKDFTPAARIWDFVSRIFVAYFVYQTIQAFRKLGKSSG